MREAGQRAYAYVFFIVYRHSPKLIEHVDADQLGSGSAAFTHLDEHIGSTCEDLCFRMLLQQLDRMLNAFSFVKCFYIIHIDCSPFTCSLLPKGRL